MFIPSLARLFSTCLVNSVQDSLLEFLNKTFLGDIYCLSPGSSQAHPILLGIPMDGDPRFNLNGNLLAFRSDAGLGVDNIWVTQWSSCSEAALRPHRDLDLHGSSLSSELLQSLALQEEDEALLNTGVKETEDRKRRRLLREGRLNGMLSYYEMVASLY